MGVSIAAMSFARRSAKTTFGSRSQARASGDSAAIHTSKRTRMRLPRNFEFDLFIALPRQTTLVKTYHVKGSKSLLAVIPSEARNPSLLVGQRRRDSSLRSE